MPKKTTTGELVSLHIHIFKSASGNDMHTYLQKKNFRQK